jgi:hypothetical protein
MLGSIQFPELLVLLVMVLLSAVVVAFPAGRICQRAGFPPWLGVLAVVPLANLLLLWFVALAEWPASKVREP